MKAITILQPWASLIACGVKKIETRSWPTKYLGPIAIHAGKALPRNDCQIIADTFYNASHFHFPLGEVIAIADLVDCSEMISCTLDNVNNGHKLIKVTLKNGQEITGNELAFGDYTLGRYAWVLANVRRIEPVPAKGLQRIWNWEVGENDLHIRG